MTLSLGCRAIPVVAILALVAACSGESNTETTDGNNAGKDAGTTPSGDQTGEDSGTPTETDSGTQEDASTPEPEPDPTEGCTEDKSVCVKFNVPTMSGSPTKLVMGFYKSLPPMGPPDVNAGTRNNPVVTSGQPYNVKMTNVDVSGEYFFYAALYMPNGGKFQPKAGIDYVAQTSAKVAFTGKAVTIPELTFALAK